MADFGDNLSEPEVDPAAEFLAREQDQLAGLEDELKPAVTNGTPLDGTGSFEMINTLGQGDGGFESNNYGNEDPVIEETSTPPQTEEKAVKPSSPDSQKATPQSTPVKHQPAREEPEKIKKWREEQKSRLEEKDANEEKKKAELREAAKKELEEWYKHHEELIAKTKADNRESALNAEKQFVAEADAIEPGTEWERIAKLCDFNPKSSRTSRDVSRMRSIILQLKQSPPNKSV
ncbi:clathrin light chain isoform X5 [Macrosteles quadrilineatus]|uniref:clathrin light chain isoform X5 n=1 Tax=Macrosteles quadrilineatus TaxID=74068 RepID=UPI0023E2FD68|nr:clathrin light chain isoform X5 [Macrosteles quadrilineatus]